MKGILNLAILSQYEGDEKRLLVEMVECLIHKQLDLKQHSVIINTLKRYDILVSNENEESEGYYKKPDTTAIKNKQDKNNEPK